MNFSAFLSAIPFAGLKTFTFGGLVAAAPAFLQFVSGIDPVATLGVSPTAGALIGLGIAALRIVTHTPVGKSVVPAP